MLNERQFSFCFCFEVNEPDEKNNGEETNRKQSNYNRAVTLDNQFILRRFDLRSLQPKSEEDRLVKLIKLVWQLVGMGTRLKTN